MVFGEISGHWRLDQLVTMAELGRIEEQVVSMSGSSMAEGTECWGRLGAFFFLGMVIALVEHDGVIECDGQGGWDQGGGDDARRSTCLIGSPWDCV